MTRPLRVLILEDCEDDAELLLRELKRQNYEPDYIRVDTAKGMNDALDRETWSLIISDYSMPQFTAMQALDILKRRNLDLPFVIVSGTIGEETAAIAMKSGAHDFLTKGKLSVQVSIGLSGRVKSVAVDGPVHFRTLEPCIREVVSRWMFPPSSEEYGTEFVSSFVELTPAVRTIHFASAEYLFPPGRGPPLVSSPGTVAG